MALRRIILLLALFALSTVVISAILLSGQTPPVLLFLLVTFLPFTVTILHAGGRLGWKGM